MFGLIVYGSLLHKNEIYKYDCSIMDIIPVKVLQYKRSFNLLPSVRVGIGNYKSVLNIQKSKDHFFNALLIIYKELDFSLLDEREKGYERHLLKPNNIKPYKGDKKIKLSKIYTYIGLEEKIDRSIMPNVEYLKLCLEGSHQWGDEFHEDFVKTTYMNNHIILQNFIQTGFKV
ncbi:hypothetical protein A9Q76_04970 [Arcobacter sp. 31_11_sub10_T18]|nr:hypothetical protein A9Q76_04970 [Arcobacter sp. 31_11_sub10_T18]